MRNRCVGQPRHVLLPLAPPALRIAIGDPGPCLLPRAMATRPRQLAIRGSAGRRREEYGEGPSTWTQASIVAALPLTQEQRSLLNQEAVIVIDELVPPPERCTVEHAFLYVDLRSNPNHCRVRLVRLLLGNGMDGGGLPDSAKKQGWAASGPVMFDSELVCGYWSFAPAGGFHWWVDWGQTGGEHTVFQRLIPREPFQCYGTWPLLGLGPRCGRETPVRDQYAVRVWGTGLGTRVSDSLM
jgi:hypothetical protein